MILKNDKIASLLTPEIRPERTALTRRSLSSPAFWLRRNYLGGDKRVLDYGCGKGGDVKFLTPFCKVEGYDPLQPEWSKRPEGQFDIVLLTYVLNVIPTHQERQEVLRDASSFVKDKGSLFISVRSGQDVNASRKPTWKAYSDGWITTRKTFQKGYEDIYELYRDIDPILKSWPVSPHYRGEQNKFFSLLLSTPTP